MTNDQIKECAKNEALYALNSLESPFACAESYKVTMEGIRFAVSKCDNIKELGYATESAKKIAESMIACLQAAIRHIDQATSNIDDLASRMN